MSCCVEDVGVGWGGTKIISSALLFSLFFIIVEHTLAIVYYVYIWQVSPKLSCVEICQIWMWFKESNWYFCKVETLAYGEINEQNFSNIRPCSPFN